jgi:hypothetical protein
MCNSLEQFFSSLRLIRILLWLYLLYFTNRAWNCYPQSNCGGAPTLQAAGYSDKIKKLAENLGNLIQSSKEERKSYFKTIDNVIKHLQKHHKFILKEENLGIWIAIGVTIGIVLGSSLDNIGAAIGADLDDKARKDGKVI